MRWRGDGAECDGGGGEVDPEGLKVTGEGGREGGAGTLTVGERERSNIWWSNGSLGCDGESQRENRLEERRDKKKSTRIIEET